VAAGRQPVVADLPWGCTGLATCYDLRFPELWCRLRELGARLVFLPAEWPERRIEHWRLLLRARAIENQCFVAGCNRAGAGVDGTFGGYSGIVDPWGRVLAEAGADAGLVVARLDLAEADRTRSLFPFFSDRRPDLYR
jgi:predicted amidohydrolase